MSSGPTFGAGGDGIADVMLTGAPMTGSPEDRGEHQSDDGDVLGLFAADPVQATKKYEEIRRRTIRILRWRGCGDDAEELWSKTAEILVEKVRRGEEVRHVEALMSGVIDNLFHKWLEKKQRNPLVLTDPIPDLPDQSSHPRFLDCLASCRRALKAEDWDLLEAYHLDDRERLAADRGISAKRLRNLACAARAELRGCLEHCLDEVEHLPESAGFFRRMSRIFKSARRG